MGEDVFRIGTAEIGGIATVVVGHGAGVSTLADTLGSDDLPADMLGLIRGWDRWGGRIRAAVAAGAPATLDVNEFAWLPPMLPPKLLCIGANYQKHNAEMLGELQQPHPYTFLKPPSTTVVATGAAVRMPRYATKVDYEAEVGVVIGAADDVFGYTIFNDLSVRDWVPGATVLGIDWVMSKGFDDSAPLGPWVLPAEFVADPQRLSLRLWVNDELRQDGNTADMVFTVRECVKHLARVLTLEPGDVVGTGTPDGVGMGTGRYLNAGDRIRIEIEGLGVQETTMIAHAAS